MNQRREGGYQPEPTPDGGLLVPPPSESGIRYPPPFTINMSHLTRELEASLDKRTQLLREIEAFAEVLLPDHLHDVLLISCSADDLEQLKEWVEKAIDRAVGGATGLGGPYEPFVPRESADG